MLDRKEVHCDCIGITDDIKFLTRKNPSQESVPHPKAEENYKNTKISLRKTRVFSHLLPEQVLQPEPNLTQEVEQPLNFPRRRNQPDPEPFLGPVHTRQIPKNSLDREEKQKFHVAPNSSAAFPLRQSVGWTFFSLKQPPLQTQQQGPTCVITSARNLKFPQEASRKNTEAQTISRRGNPSLIQIKSPTGLFSSMNAHPPLSQERISGPNRAPPSISMPFQSFHFDEPHDRMKVQTMRSLQTRFVMESPKQAVFVPILPIGQTQRTRNQGPNSQRAKNPNKSAQELEDKGAEKIHTKRSKETDRFKSCIQAHSPTGQIRTVISQKGSSSPSSERSDVVYNDFGKNLSECVGQGEMRTIATKESNMLPSGDNGFEQLRWNRKISQQQLSREDMSANFF